MTGSVIAFEGLDGSGKSTQVLLLQQYFEAHGQKVTVYPLYRMDVVEAMLGRLDQTGMISNVGSRYAVMAKILCRQEWEIRDRLARGEIVIYDKFLLTFLTTEIVRGCSEEELLIMSQDVMVPDYTLFLEVRPKDAIARKNKRLGYRESGLDIALYDGEPVDYNRFVTEAYPPGWVAERYLEFQQKMANVSEKLLDHPRLSGGVTRIPQGSSAEESHLLIRRALGLTPQ